MDPMYLPGGSRDFPEGRPEGSCNPHLEYHRVGRGPYVLDCSNKLSFSLASPGTASRCQGPYNGWMG